MGKAIGIDLGTTNSCVAVYEGGQATVLPNAEGGRTTPSVVGFDGHGGVLVGAVAKRQAIANPTSTIQSAKRFIGRKAAEVQEEAQLLPYEIAAGDSGDACLRVSGRSLKPQQVSAYVLEKLKQDAETYLGEQVSEAVITVPAYFNNAQREATREAATLAGLKTLRIVNEPTAAALAYGLDKSGDRRVLVFDLGGGTFDVSVLEIGEGVFEVRSTAGDNHLGGDDFDRAIVEWLVEDFRKQHGADLHKDPLALQRLWEAAERAKVELSTLERTTIALPYLTAGADGPLHLEKMITRSQLTTLCSKLLQRVQAPVEQALADAGIDVAHLDAVVLVGGMTRMPAVQAAVRTITGKEPQQGVNPDEVVAIGAAIQAGVITGSVRDVVLLDVTPLSLGVEIKGGIFSRLLDRNTTIPTRRSELYTTSRDNQDFVEIHVLQGESDIAVYNKSLGRFKLDGIPAAPKGGPQIQVTFDIDSNGILSVSARDLQTGVEQQVTISGSDVPPAEVERLVREAEARRDEAAKLRRLVEARERADVIVEAGERALGQYTQLLPTAELREAQIALDALKDARDQEVALTIEQALHRFAEASKRLVASAAAPHTATIVPGIAAVPQKAATVEAQAPAEEAAEPVELEAVEVEPVAAEPVEGEDEPAAETGDEVDAVAVEDEA